MADLDIQNAGHLKSWLKLTIGLGHELLSNEQGAKQGAFDELRHTLQKGTAAEKEQLRFKYNISFENFVAYQDVADNEQALFEAILKNMLTDLEEYNRIKDETDKQRSSDKKTNIGQLGKFYQTFYDKLKAENVNSTQEYNQFIAEQDNDWKQILTKTQERMRAKHLYTEVSFIIDDERGDQPRQDHVSAKLVKAAQAKQLKFSPDWQDKKQKGAQACKLDCSVGYKPTGSSTLKKVNLTRVDNMGLSQKAFISLMVANLGKPTFENIPEDVKSTTPDFVNFENKENPANHIRFTTKENGQDVKWGVFPIEKDGQILHCKYKVEDLEKYIKNDPDKHKLEDFVANPAHQNTMYGHDYDRKLDAPYKNCTTVRELVREQYRHIAEHANRYGVDLYSNVIKEGADQSANNRAGAPSAFSAKGAAGEPEESGVSATAELGKKSPRPS